MPRNEREGLLLSVFMSLIMIYVMAALNDAVKLGTMTGDSWVLALERLPLGFLFGIVCDLCICTPLSRKLVGRIFAGGGPEAGAVFLMRASMVVLMTVFMTGFGVVASGQLGWGGVRSFFVYFPYNFTIALPIQMGLVAPLSLRLARGLSKKWPLVEKSA